MIKDRITWPRLTILVALFLLLWIAAWIVHNQVVAPGFHLVAGSVADTVYWMIAKLLVWVVFPFLFVAQPLWKQATLIGLQAKYLRRDLIFGAGAAAFWLILSALRFFLTGQHFALTMSAFIAFYTVILTPLFEEIMFRGYIQSTLAALKTPFLLADVVTTALFLVPHCIGWSFQGVLAANLTFGGIGTIAIISLLLGFVRYASNSLVGSTLLHMVNNLISILVH
ncbi:MAG TPA: CPBP family intramembrane glutamic endopeptidase [Ktedonosporobacter sp.]|nr:CPBP family intramembrane glutamic endopeptidase [Ktedonosporobacter sp.]